MKDILQALPALLNFLEIKISVAIVMLLMYSMFLWDKRHPASAKTSDRHKPTDTLNTAKEASTHQWPLFVVLFALFSTFLFSVLPDADKPLSTGDAAALLGFFMLFITGSVLFFRD